MSETVSYAVDDSTVVQFEIEPVPGVYEAGHPDVVGRVRESLDPVVAAARVVLARVCEAGPEEVQVRFGVKVTGTTSWLVAKAAAEGNFEVTLTWRPGETSTRSSGS